MASKAPALQDVLTAYGASWQIVHDAEIGVWTAVNRPTPTALHFICAHNLASLAVKLAATGDRGLGSPSPLAGPIPGCSRW